MENAAKALLIAGGVLLALLIISVMVYMFSQIKSLQQAQETKIEQEQIAEFNKGFETYDKKVMYGADVISVLNKAANNNTKYIQSDYQISVLVQTKVYDESIGEMKDLDISVSGSTVSPSNYFELIGKTELYKCTSITYNSTTARVSGLTFELYNS